MYILGVCVILFFVLLVFHRTSTHQESYELNDYFKLMQHVHQHFSRASDDGGDVYGILKLDGNTMRVVVQHRDRLIISVHDVTYDATSMRVTNVKPAVLTPSIKSDMHMLIKKSPLFL